jgi:hypothetical protein
MTSIRRFGAVGAILTLAVVVSSSQVFGEPNSKARQPSLATGSKAIPEQAADSLAKDLAATKFADRPVLTYRTKDGNLLFALQIKPKLDTAFATKPCDYLIMVDTSASQIGKPLADARMLAQEMAKAAHSDDRIAIWTVNIPDATKALTKGFQDPKAAGVKEAVKVLRSQVVPLGDTDLKKGLQKAIASFENDSSRQRAIILLGDGMSIHNPITPADRALLCEEMVKNEIAFFPIPLGPRLDPQNLHGFASGTGGAVIRVGSKDKVEDTVKRLRTAVAAPILYTSAFRVPAASVAEFFPTRLPPLRTDAATLVVGNLKDTQKLSYIIEGTAGGKDVRLETSETVPQPELDNFFLVSLVSQWKNAKEQPALMQADRALAYAEEMNILARTEFLAQAEMALAQNQLGAASKLYGQAKELDPSDPEAAAGVKVVEKLRDGKLTREQLRQQFDNRAGMGTIFEKDPANSGTVKVRRIDRLQLLAQADEKPAAADKAAPVNPATPPVDPKELLRQERQKQAVEEQRITQSVDDAIREARRLLRSDPDSAKDLLKRTLAAVNDDPNLTENTRRGLTSRLESSLRNVETEGTRIKNQQAEQQRVRAIALERSNTFEQRAVTQEKTQARMRAFHQLMNQGRDEDAHNLAQGIIDDAFRMGVSVPVSVNAAYTVALTAQNLHELQELKRVREERYLQTMMQVEKSHVPFPDEPPVQFPPAAVWRELTALRKERYESSGLTDEDPVTLKRIRDLKSKMEMPVTVEFESGPLKDALGFLTERYNVPILVDSEAFKTDVNIPDVENTPVKLQKVVGISLGTVLRLLLSQVQGTFIIRREFIEVTTAQRQAAEKALRVYPVADLVIPIPNGINQQAVNQAIQNSILGAEIQLTRAATFVGFGGNIGGAFAGGFGFGGGGGQFAGAAGGFGGGQFGGIGGGGIGGAAGLQGGIQNQGVGGGVSGFAGFGGQLGQFGNLGGQFGLQGGDQSAILIRLIRQVIGEARDWSPLGIYDRGPGVGVPQGGRDADDENAGDPNVAGAIGYYPPARALVVKATSRVNTRLGGGLLGPRAAGPAPDKQGKAEEIKKDFLAKNKDIGDPSNKKLTVAAASAKSKDGKTVSESDARKIWQEALEKGVNDPGLIIAVADFLFEHRLFNHAAEFLKAELRQAIVARPWVYEALAIALKESKGSQADIERAQLSAIDLEPQDTQSFLNASQAMADNKRWDRAVAFCRQASLLEPNAPQAYVDALSFAELGKDTEAMEWATSNLLSRDWPVENEDLHRKAYYKLTSLVDVLRNDKRLTDAEKLNAAVARHLERDFVVNLMWQGQADLDLEIKEPVGTVCSFMHRQTPGGGILIGDSSSQVRRETYTVAQGFSGNYEIIVHRVWGHPLGGKATVEIIEHQGTPQETRRRETIEIDQKYTLKAALANGRRTSLAQVAPPASTKPKRESTQVASTTDIRTKLLMVSDPDYLASDTGISGGMASTGMAAKSSNGTVSDANQSGQIAVQTKVSQFTNTMDMTAQASVSSDRRYVRLSMSPVFQTAGGSQGSGVNISGLLGQ